MAVGVHEPRHQEPARAVDHPHIRTGSAECVRFGGGRRDQGDAVARDAHPPRKGARFVPGRRHRQNRCVAEKCCHIERIIIITSSCRRLPANGQQLPPTPPGPRRGRNSNRDRQQGGKAKTPDKPPYLPCLYFTFTLSVLIFRGGASIELPCTVITSRPSTEFE